MVERNIKGQKGAEGHAGATNVPRALQVKRCFIADEIKNTERTIQLFSPCQFCEKASTASQFGDQNNELNLLSFVFVRQRTCPWYTGPTDYLVNKVLRLLQTNRHNL